MHHGRPSVRRAASAEPEPLRPAQPTPARSAPVPGPQSLPRRNAPLAPPPPHRRMPPRGTLLEKLAQCQANSDSLISDMQSTFKSRFDRSGLLLQVQSKHLHVGRCDSQFAGTARFMGEELVYKFEHPHHRQVEMHMKYADMHHPRLQTSPAGVPELRFRINRELVYFAREYEHANPAHQLALGFVTKADASKFSEGVLPQLLARAKG